MRASAACAFLTLAKTRAKSAAGCGRMMKWVQCPTAQGAAARTGRPQTALQRLQSLNQGRSLCPALSFPRPVSGVKCLMFQQTVSSVQCSIFSVSTMLVSGVSWPVQTENATRPREKNCSLDSSRCCGATARMTHSIC